MTDVRRSGESRSLEPQDAATLIILDATGRPRILMGRRRPQQVFLPNKFVFPGGRADKVDRAIPATDELGVFEILLRQAAGDGLVESVSWLC